MTADWSALEIAVAVRDGGVTATAVFEATRARIAAHNPALNAFTMVSEAGPAAPDPAAPLAGAPFAVKNLFDIAGVTTLAGAKMRLDAAPAQEDAFAVAQMKRAGATLVGALNMDEFAYGFTTENAHFGATRNPHDLDHVAGGSSGGSAAAVAAGLCTIALGSDTNGSVRVPAALCGVWGIKATYGRLSRRGVFPFVHSLDHVGAFTRTVGDLAATYAALDGEDPRDRGQIAPRAAPSSEASRIGVLDGWFHDTANEDARAAVRLVADALGARDQITLTDAGAARAAAFCLTAAEGGAMHLPTLRTHAHAYDPATRERLTAGAMMPASIAMRAQRVRERFRRQVAAVFETVDLLLAPATPFAAPRIGQAMVRIADREVLARASLGVFTQPISFIGLPVVTAPVVRAGQLPLGVQIIGPPWAEARVLAAAQRLEDLGVCRPAKPTALFA